MKDVQDGYFVHPSSIIDDGAQIGNGSRIWHFCHVMNGAILGDNVVLGQNVFVGGRAVIGDGCKIQNNVSLYDDVVLENDVFCGPSCVFTNVINPRSFVERKNEYRKTLVEQGASIGANATIVCGVTLGRYCFVGAGSVVTRDISAHEMVYGNPARNHGWVCRCGEKLPDRNSGILSCESCGLTYEINENHVDMAGEKKNI